MTIRSSLSLLFFVSGICFLISACSKFDIAKCQSEEECGPILEVKKISGSLPTSPNDPIWSSNKVSKPTVAMLGPQLIANPQWPNPATQEVRVQAARTSDEIAILIEWNDSSHKKNISHSDMYTDQAALMFPMNDTEEAPPITMGADGYPMNIWQWKEILEKPDKKNLFSGPGPLSRPDQTNQKMDMDQKKSPVEDLNAEGFSTLTQQDQQDVKGKGNWANGKWRTLFHRKIKSSDENDAKISRGKLMAIAIWNGANRERNGQKGLSKWLFLKFI
jgi:DMSO reductase family type II enzyme heme b subunit